MVLPLFALWFLANTCPDTLPRHLSSSSSTHFVTTRACVYIYIYILGVQFNADLSSVKNIFKSVQYLNKEYSIYYPVVFDGCDVCINYFVKLEYWTRCRGVVFTGASSPAFCHQGTIAFSIQCVSLTEPRLRCRQGNDNTQERRVQVVSPTFLRRQP